MDAFTCCSTVDMCNELAAARTTSAGARKLREGKAGVGVVLKAKRGEEQLLIASMHPGGPAEVSGRVFEGDELLSIDGVPVQVTTGAFPPVPPLSAKKRSYPHTGSACMYPTLTLRLLLLYPRYRS